VSIPLFTFSYDPLLVGIAIIWAIAALILFWIWRCHIFEGKRYFILSFFVILWWVFALGMEVSSLGLQRKSMWTLFTWPAMAILPVAWSLYIEEFVRGRDLAKNRVLRSIIVGIPLAVSLGAVTNPWHHWMFTQATVLSEDGTRVLYDYGPLFYAAALLLYPFIFRAMLLLVGAMRSSADGARSLLLT
jgi:hypothetical protein